MQYACRLYLIFALVLALVSTAGAAGNTTNDSFSRAKKNLGQIYADHRVTVYCGAAYNEQGYITLPPGFTTPSHHKRAEKIEWEHIVPAENFGRAFAEWRDGDPLCVDNRGKAFKGRKCAEKVNMEYRRMQADMHNLAPAIGAVNALRQNYNFTMLPGVENTFGSCAMKIEGNRAEPPETARGMIARTYKYMAGAYPRYSMGGPTEKLMDAWDRMYPPDAWECARAKRIEAVQGNGNPAVREQCLQQQLGQEVESGK